MKNHLQVNWWKYLAAILLPVIVWCSIFSAIAAPNATSRVNVLYIGDGLDCESLQQQLAQTLPELTGQNIRSVTVDSTMLEGDHSHALLTARCFDYDILIFQQDSLPHNIGQAIFARLTQGLLAHFPNAVPYTEETRDAGTLPFGLVLYSGTEENRFSGCYAGSQSCYLFFSPYSENFDGLNENGSTGNDAALKAVQYLMEKES